MLPAIVVFSVLSSPAVDVPIVDVEGQPLAANLSRIAQALEFLGKPLPAQVLRDLSGASKKRDARRMQESVDDQVSFVVSLNPEVRVKVARGPAAARLQQAGFTPVLIKVLNDSTVTRQLNILSPQAGPVYAGSSLGILERQAQTELNDRENVEGKTDRFLALEMFRSPPMTPQLSGLSVEYAIALLYSSESGKREATIGFDVGSGTQDIGFRGEVATLFDIAPAREVRLRISDFDNTPTIARLVFRNNEARVFPPQPKRLAPDLFFQPQVYRSDGETILLPPGVFNLEFSRGPEYEPLKKTIKIPSNGPAEISLSLRRWVNPQEYGFVCGDHHIHGAGCSHYQIPTQGVTPQDMFRQVKGEGLNVGCVLTWGPCFDYQRQFFAPTADSVSEPMTLLKYDLEISGFGSAALGHVCLLNLRNQTYPGSEGTKTKGWPTWTVPVMRWAKLQGGYTGYPHSAMHVNPASAARRILEQSDRNGDGQLTAEELASRLTPEPFDRIDSNQSGTLDAAELTNSLNRVADQLPNLAIPEMNGAGAMEICVSAAEGVCDFISAMDTARIPEWNTWYHLLNCGLPIKLSGETDFPCMSSRRVGQGRVYVRMGDIRRVDFTQWCEGLAKGRSYVSDGYSHALQFTVNGVAPGNEDVRLDQPAKLTVEATVAFAPRLPRGVAYGNQSPPAGKRMVGDTVQLHVGRSSEFVQGGKRTVEIVCNGQVVGSKQVEADGELHELTFHVPVSQSSWIALRQFPQLHTNPVNVFIDDKPVRASKQSAQWCEETIKLLWKNRKNRISEDERQEAWSTYQRAMRRYQSIASEAE